jgi:hypothetical protein
MNDAALTPRVGLSNTLRGGFFADGMQNVGPEPYLTASVRMGWPQP